MNAFKILLFGLLCAACGDQLVEFPLGDDSLPDARGGDDVDADPGVLDADPGAPDADLGDAPFVESTGPADLAIDVSLNRRITAIFDRAMDPATISAATFQIRQGPSVIDGDVTYVGRTATFTPVAPLDVSLEYTATITTGAADPDGRALVADHVWTFTTDACGMRPVSLLSAGRFAVLAGSSVTSTGLSVVTGDLGVSPSTSITGFGPGVLVGAQHAGDATAAQAMADLTTAYDEAAARTLCSTSIAGNLGSMTLTPGLYTSTSSIAISSGELTLDAQGDPDAIFIFQTASTLTVTSGRQVILTNGARAANVYWQIGSSATLGTGATFAGTILAYASITLETGASLDGRALAKIAGVTLDANAVTRPAP